MKFFSRVVQLQCIFENEDITFVHMLHKKSPTVSYEIKEKLLSDCRSELAFPYDWRGFVRVGLKR
jgi:hypothetical protein